MTYIYLFWYVYWLYHEINPLVNSNSGEVQDKQVRIATIWKQKGLKIDVRSSMLRHRCLGDISIESMEWLVKEEILYDLHLPILVCVLIIIRDKHLTRARKWKVTEGWMY